MWQLKWLSVPDRLDTFCCIDEEYQDSEAESGKKMLALETSTSRTCKIGSAALVRAIQNARRYLAK
jgi:hypothetical protein